MNSAGVDGLVLDLRMNGGGSLPAVADVASLFLPPDTDVMHIENSDGRVDTVRRCRAFIARPS
jgi:C-terminal processing protease CtpA/Prc